MSSAEEQEISAMSVDVDHNPYLAEGAGTVDAIVSIGAGRGVAASPSGPAAPADRVEAIIIDCSSSMQSPIDKFDAARRATAAAIDELVDGTYFTIVAGTEEATAVYPVDGWPTPASAATKAAATRAVDGLRPGGGTAMGTWLAHVRGIVVAHPGALIHAILLTDGKDEHETPEQLGEEIGLSEGEFTCDCRGVGTDWHVDELRSISSALLGTVDIVADPADLADDFAAMMRDIDEQVDSRCDVAPVDTGRRPRRVRQTSRADRRRPDTPSSRRRKPDRGVPAGLLGRRGPRLPHSSRGRTGGGRTREAGRAGECRCGRRGPGRGPGEGGLDRRHGVVRPDQSQGGALHRPGRAGASSPGRVERTQERRHQDRDRQPAARDGTRREIGKHRNGQAAQGVVEVDERTGTVRLRREVAAADEMALDARSTRTARVRKET